MSNQKHCRSCPHLDFNEMSDEMYCKLKDYELIRLRWHKNRPNWCPLVNRKAGRMSENRLDKAIRDVAYVLNSLIALRNIHDTGCCNDCECLKGCAYKPEWGKPVRYNCPFYVRKGG